ncbi:MAG TPA: NnrS family protein [Terriglobia bacterium]|nr:NnrS family protein [Terriglobia bacterium]
MPQHGESTDPYRIFFPLGIVFGIVGVSIWPLYYYGVTEGYSGRAHAFVQTDGFLYAFIAGFLLTAVPRFTGTEAPSRRVQYALAAVVICCAAAFEFQFFIAGHTIFIIEHLFLLTLIIRRFLRRRQNPPETFPLVGIGLLSGTLAALINAGIAWNIIGPFWDPLGKRLMTEGMVLLLVLGIGGFLGPRLLGFAQLPQFTNIERTKAEAIEKRAFLYALAGLIILLSLVSEYGFGRPAMAFVRAAIVSIVILSTLQPWRRPAVRTTLAWCVWFAHWFVILAVWVVAFVPRYRIDFLHILFIGGFTLLILAVGTRVTLSHGGHGLAQERRSWPLRIGISTGFIAMIARVGAPFAGFTYFAHLAWAGILWIAGMLAWGLYVFRLIRTRPAPQLPE